MDTSRVPPEPVEIAVMAKAPQPGYSKTRLIPALGARAAARLQRQLTLRTLATARAAAIGPVTLWCAPDTGHRFFRALQRRHGLDLRAQPDLDLGRRMGQVFAENVGAPLLLIGTDCPALSVEHLRQAALALRSPVDAVFITTEDGGYFLVGLNQPCPAIFEGIEWSTARVMAQTRSRMSALGLRWQEVARLWDVDRPEDVARWQALQRGEAGLIGVEE
ncbi:MAG: TIGR04282 family arsenosugar biosynthesis glycosyltransferase [Sulfuritalea sp.]|nr:TIGR04282 family arsenosugar biosynthesis glycosyltransferase [Sulfuritalea sp.]